MLLGRGLREIPRTAVALALAAVTGCASQAAETLASPTSADAALDDAVARHGCEFLSDHFLALADEQGVSTGRAWVQRCEAQRETATVRVRTTVIGWQWLDRRASGFDVREYVYFRARVEARIGGHLGTGRAGAMLAFRAGDVAVTVEEIGRVSARPATLASRFVGAAASVFGSGPNSVATSAMRGEVEKVLRERLERGGTWSLDDAKMGASLVDEKQALHAGGALLTGPLRQGDASRILFSVDGDVLARAVCLDEVKGLVETVIAGEPTHVPPPLDTHRLRGTGTWLVAPMPCPWVLVTGAADDRDARLHIGLEKAPSPSRCGERACVVRVTLEAFDVPPRKEDGQPWDPNDGAPDVAFTLEVGGRSTPLGRVFPDTLAAAPWLASAPFELPAGGAVTLHVADLDPLPPKLLEAQRWTREAIGVATVKAAELVHGARLRLPLRTDASAERGSVHVRVEVVEEP